MRDQKNLKKENKIRKTLITANQRDKSSRFLGSSEHCIALHCSFRRLAYLFGDGILARLRFKQISLEVSRKLILNFTSNRTDL